MDFLSAGAKGMHHYRLALITRMTNLLFTLRTYYAKCNQINQRFFIMKKKVTRHCDFRGASGVQSFGNSFVTNMMSVAGSIFQ